MYLYACIPIYVSSLVSFVCFLTKQQCYEEAKKTEFLTQSSFVRICAKGTFSRKQYKEVKRMKSLNECV